MDATGDGRIEPGADEWRAGFVRILRVRFAAEAAASLEVRYRQAFDPGYRSRYGPEAAVRDVALVEGLDRPEGGGSAGRPVPDGDGPPLRGPVVLDLYRPHAADPRAFRLKLFHLGGPVHLSDSLPMLENMGLRVEDEYPRELHRAGAERCEVVWLHDFGLRRRDGSPVDLDAAGETFKECFARVWAGDAEDDGFNRLALAAHLEWREIALLRAYAKYLRQIQFGLSQSYIEDTLSGNPALVRDLVRLFHARFDPAGASGAAARATLPEAREILPEPLGRESSAGRRSREVRPAPTAAAKPGTMPGSGRGPAASAGARASPRGRAAAPRTSSPLSDGAPPYEIAERILAGLEAVSSLDEDRILRTCFELVEGTLRTNFYRRAPDGGGPRACLALKLSPSSVHEAPEPKPHVEIFVYSPRFEGTHLRGGPIARGGIRWSDRREDFRTEVLGLLKTQMVKNAVIVPVGAKGGFVLKRPPADRAALAREGLACYREFIAALLELTDSYVGREVVPPQDTVRHDGDDPYLVVAADKGTATFSDAANELSTAAGFWLGDAFASGGSEGYDHKGIGITARGAWESVKSHFRVLGLDPEGAPFTAVGIGDMSGDVFGNGMLRSRRIRLVAAFSHLHVFIDPDPDPEASFGERARLFQLPGSTWADYRPALISRGGGVWPRTAKSIPLSAEAVNALGIAGGGSSGTTSRTPNDVIRAILRAPVALLWNGGIGVYVKASGESHSMVGDRSNDSVRINARELRCRVVAEGGNLGFSQAARVEYARAGGLINTDAIDNSGGVDCSDHEVNIKILLDAAIRDGALEAGERSRLLHGMTDEVAERVLRNNALQNAGLAIARTQAASLIEVHARFIEHLERSADLDRAAEGLPDRDEVAERRRAGEGLAGPELAVLVAYAKLDLFDALAGSRLPEDPEMAAELAAYFPQPVRERLAPSLAGHRLAREIVATLAANETVNRAGITFAFRITDEIGGAPEDAVRAYFALRGLYRLPDLFAAIEGAELPVAAHVAAMLELRKLTDRGARWLLRNAPRPLAVDSVVYRYRVGVQAASGLIPALAPAPIREEMQSAAADLAQAGVPSALAHRLAACSQLPAALDVTEVALRHAAATGSGPPARPAPDVEQAARAWYGIDALLDVGWLQARIAALPRADRWQALARGAIRGDLLRLHRALAAQVLREGAGARPDAALRSWRNANARAIRRWTELIASLKAEPQVEYPMVAVALRELREVGRES